MASAPPGTPPLEKITFGDGLPGYICGWAGSSGVVLLQEWWGVTETVKAQAQKVAAQGYRCLVPDLCKGTVGVDVEEARHLMAHLDWPRALAEVLQAAQYLRDNGALKVGVMGFCMGGALAAAVAQRPDLVDCALAFYGLPDAKLCRPKAVQAPISLHVGQLDLMEWCGVKATTAFSEAVRRAGGTAELHVYEQCGHSFLNEGPDSQRKRAATGYPEPPPEQQQLAWAHVFDFLSRHLLTVL